MTEERPIIFTVTQQSNRYSGLYRISTKNAEFKDKDFANYTDVTGIQLFDIMKLISEQINEYGYAVLFEID